MLINSIEKSTTPMWNNIIGNCVCKSLCNPLRPENPGHGIHTDTHTYFHGNVLHCLQYRNVNELNCNHVLDILLLLLLTSQMFV